MFARLPLKFFMAITLLAMVLSLLPQQMAWAHPAVAPTAEGVCGARYTVVRGDSLRIIANRCETTVDAILRSNPEIKDPNRIFVGQVLVMPGAVLEGGESYDVYIVQSGDTLRKIANRFNTTVERLLILNKDITNASVIYVGQRLIVPATVVIPDTGNTTGDTYVVQSGDTLRKIATRFNTTVDQLLKMNPQIKDANRIYVGQKILVPTSGTTYTVQPGDTLRKIAERYSTTIDAILKLNPNIRNANIIYVGQVIRVR